MEIINHGTWSGYVPDPYPANLPPNISFAKNDESGRDWYDALYSETPLCAADSVKVTATKEADGSWRLQAASVDATRVFPHSQLLIEIIGYAGTNPQADFGQKRYDAATNTISEFQKPPRSVTPRQIRLALNQIGLRQQVEDWVKSQDQDTQDNWSYATEFVEDNPLLVACVAAVGKTEADKTALFDLALTL
ncbi:hypothetical protein [Bradyrhizobium elkanii]|uniref:Uncharacterized protein n=1 Tax=Bradyrhizobium diazoefficiens TaxID=1355477 RepID=A0A809Z7N4_9BRAD|nr:hypothetical protein XF1B_48800 [Bradyrhizobium diazoefficiens]BCE48464.1 hypothetical protein XF4B_48130 [Bradyrhizobium diazoefficiens]BCE91980.1 hypothetical protein XF10B_47780 [Bradyrhizobium diazoefficiens]BCF26908.1 hypothetical protein XF14B_48600 [Bradyrhizobium diazoefficiens]